MLRPDRADFFIRRKLALGSFVQRSFEIGGFLERKLIGRLVNACGLQHDPCEIVLRFVWQGGNGLYGLF